MDSQPMQPVEQPPRQQPGYKITASPHRDAVATMLLMKKGYAAVLRYLEEQKFPVHIHTVKEFELNYVSGLSQEVRDKLIAAAKKSDDRIVTQSVHSRLSRVESLVQQLEYAEEQLIELNLVSAPTTAIVYQRGQWTDRICFLRGKLEDARIESEVELERDKAILAVADVAAEFIKDANATEQFIKRVAAIRNRQLQTD